MLQLSSDHHRDEDNTILSSPEDGNLLIETRIMVVIQWFGGRNNHLCLNRVTKHHHIVIAGKTRQSYTLLGSTTLDDTKSKPKDFLLVPPV